MFPNQMHGQMTAMTGMAVGKKKTHRGSRGGKKKKAGSHSAPPVNAHHAQAQAHLTNAANAPTPQAAHTHLFKALTALNKAKGVALPVSASAGAPSQSMSGAPQPSPAMGGMPNA